MIEPGHLPPPIQPRPPHHPSAGAVALLTVLGVGFLALLAWVALPLAQPSPVLSGPLLEVQREPLLMATFPTELLTMAVALSTYVAPTPTKTPTPVTPTRVPLSAPIFCGMGSAVGDVCKWSAPTPSPPPPPPPLPACKTPVPGAECVDTGEIVRRVLLGTPAAGVARGAGR